MLGDVAVDARFSRDELQRSVADDAAEIGRQRVILRGDEHELHERFLQLLSAQPPQVSSVYRKQKEFQERATDLLDAACAADELAPHLTAFYSRKLLTFARRWPIGSTLSERRLERLMALLRRLQLALVRHELRAEMSGVPALLPEDEARAHLLSLCVDDADRAWLNAQTDAPFALASRVFLEALPLPADARVNFNPARAVYVLPEDLPPPPSELLFAVLNREFAVAHQRLAAPLPEAQEPRPLTTLLVCLQRRAVQNAARCRALALPRVQLLLRYAAELLRLSGLFAAALAPLPLPAQLAHWNASPCALLLSPLLPSLLALHFTPPPPNAPVDPALLTFSVLALPLEQLVPSLSRLVMSPETSRWSEEEAARGRQVWAPVEVESAHPYVAGTDEAHHVHIPGAAYLLVSFDSRCATEKGDTVQLFRRVGRQDPVGVPLSGRGQEWPQGALLVDGGSVCVSFTAGPYGSASLFGFKVTIRAVPFDAPRSPSFDLLSNATLLTAKALSALMHEPRSHADEVPLEPHLALVLAPPLASAAPLSTWCADLAELKAGSPAADAWATRSATGPASTNAALERIERIAAAALARHSHTTALSPALLRAARQVRDWSAAQRQRWADVGESDAALSAVENRAQLLLASAAPSTPVTHDRIVAFLCLSLRPSHWQALFARRSARARNRAHALNAFAALAKLPAPHLSLLLLAPLSAALTEATHPLAGVRGTGLEERAVSSAWSELLHAVSSLLTGPLLPLLCIAWRPEDMPFLVELRVLPALFARLSQLTSDEPERARIEHVIRFLVLRIAEAPCTDALHRWLISHLIDQLLVANLPRANSDAAAEHVAFFAASMLRLLSLHASFATLILTPRVASLALQLEEANSPRLKRLALRLLGSIAAHLPPSALPRPIPELLFARLSALLAEEQWAEHTTHEARYDHGADVAALLRRLAALPAYQSAVSGLLSPALEPLRSASVPSAQLGSVLAALSLLGGTLERLRPGVRVEVSGDKAPENAVLVCFDAERNSVRVSPNAAPAAIAHCERTRLSVQLSPPPPADLFTEERLVLLSKFLLSLPSLPPPPPPSHVASIPSVPSSNSLTAAAAAAPSPVMPRLQRQAREWDCEQCTLHNVASAMMCAVCEAPAPLPSRPATPQPRLNVSSTNLTISSSATPAAALSQSNTSVHSVVIGGAPPSLTEFATAQLGWRVALALSQGLVLAPTPFVASLSGSALLSSLASWTARAGPLADPCPLHALCHLHDASIDRLANALAHATHLYSVRSPSPFERPTDALVASPFKSADLLLPTCLHRGSAKHTRFPSASLLTARARAAPPQCGLVRGDQAVPSSVPMFYFEITLEGGVAAALGMWREGVPLDGLPGDSASFALAAASGTKHHGDITEPYTDSASPGDTFGCLLDQRRHSIAFTRNGTLIGTAFTGLHTRLVPVIWLLAPDTLVHVNFGQHAFRFDLAPLLPPDAVPRGGTRAPISEAQLRREAMAEELRAMMGDSFPLALCSTALERSRDSMDAAAAWLLEKGYAEMDRVARELLAQTDAEQLDAVKRMSLQDAQQRARSPAPQAEISASGSGVDLAASVDEDPDAEAEAEADEDARAAARLLDDQLGLERPLLAQEAPTAVTSVPMRLSELQVNILVQLASPPRIARLLSVDFDAETVQVELFEHNTALTKRLQLPAAALRRAPSGLVAENDQLADDFAQLNWHGEALALQSVRKALLHMLTASAGALDVAVLGGALRFAQLLKLLSAEFLVARAPDAPTAAAARDARRPFELLRSRLEATLASAPIASLASMPAKLPLTRGEAAPRWCTDEAPLLPVLVEECVAHVVRAVEAPPPYETLESPHPYSNHSALRRKLHVPGAAALLVRFDRRTHLHPSDPLTSLALFRDAAHTQQLAAMRGAAAQDPQAFAPLVLPGDTLYVRFTSGAGSTFWGFRLIVVPLLLHVSDSTALASGNFPLALWLFSLLLDAPPAAVSSRYVPELYRALLFFVRHARRAAKGAGLQLLTRLLGHMRTCPPPEPVVSAADIAVFRRLLERRQETEGARVAGRPFSPRLQALAQLLAAAELALAAHVPLPVPVVPLSALSLRALSPRLVLPSDPELAARLDAEGGAVLRIMNAPRRLNVLYQVLHPLLPSTPLETAEISIARGQGRVIAVDHLEPVTSVASASAALVSDRPLPFPIAAPALLRAAFSSLPFVRITGAQQPISPPLVLWAPPHLESFSISLWLLIAADAPAQTRRVITREASPAWALSVDAQRRVLFSANGQTLTSRNPLPTGSFVHVLVHCDPSVIAAFIAGAAEGERRMQTPVRPAVQSGAVLSLGEAARPGVQVADVRIYPRLEPAAGIASRGVAINVQEELLSVPLLQSLVQMLPRLNLALLCDAAALLQCNTPPLEHQFVSLYPQLAPLSAPQRAFAIDAVQQLNSLVSQVLPLIDLTQHAQPWSLAAQLSQLKGAVLFPTKTAYLDALLTATATRAPRPAVSVSRPRALKVRERGGDSTGKHSVFGQLFRALHFSAPESLRQSGVTWSVTYVGEGGTDAGGLFRDSMSHVCAELQDASGLLPLLVQAPNARSRVGSCQERWLIRASSDSALQLDMFAFLGKLLGIALRGRHALPLDLHPYIWRALVGAVHSPQETLEQLDAALARSLEALESQSDEDSFSVLFPDLTWTLSAPDGQSVELCPTGASRPVLFSERAAYVAACRAHLLQYGRVQLDAMRSGLATIVPLPLLVLFTASELELACCGSTDVDLDLLRENTKYSDGLTEADQSVQWLWRMLTSFSTKQRQQFLRFVWGRSRLPLRSAHFEQKFVVLASPRSTDHVLPVSRTCFFQLELPRYSSYEVMHAKFVYAITEGIAIDADHRAQDLNWDQPLDDNEQQNNDNDNAGEEQNEDGGDGGGGEEAEEQNDEGHGW